MVIGVNGQKLKAREENGRVNWTEARRIYVIGHVVKLSNGEYVTQDYTYEDMAEMLSVTVATVKKKAKEQYWKAYREAYKARVDDLNIGSDLGIYTTTAYHAESAAINACNKLGSIVDTYIEAKFGKMLDLADDVMSEFSEEDKQSIVENTDLRDLKEAMTIVKELYKLQKDIVASAPNDRLTSNTTAVNQLSEAERTQKLAELKAKLGM